MPDQTAQQYDVFISYRRDLGAAMARVVGDALRAAGLAVFLDVDEINGRQFDAVLKETIAATPYFVVLLTPGSLQRCAAPGDVVALEIATAFEHGKRVLVMRTDASINPSSATLPDNLAPLKSIDAILYLHEYGRAALDKLVAALQGHIDGPRQIADQELRTVDQQLRTPHYQAWQDATLFAWYGAQAEAQAAGGHAWFPVVNGKRYPVVCFPGALDGAQFRHPLLGKPGLRLRPVQLLPKVAGNGALQIPDWVRHEPGGAARTRYFELLSYGKRVRRWNMRGYALTALHFDAQQRVNGYQAELCTYGENCLTSHLLGYQLHRQYTAAPQAPAGTAPPRPPLAADGVPVADQFFPLISVQAMVLYKADPADADSWTVIAMERGANVAAAAGFWQFPPAGGFEIYGNEDDGEDHVRSQFDMRLALIRELLEELYGDSDMACDNPLSSSPDHTGSAGYNAVRDAIDEQRLHIHFLGVITELVSLRSEFSFLIVIDDVRRFQRLSYDVELAGGQREQARWLKGSDESKRLHQFPVDDLGRLLAADKVWNPSSIGMLRLLADCSNDSGGWLRRLYPDFPALQLPA